jgi:hypothetical protein
MITKEITLCSRQVNIGYCYATEIAYKDLADENITDYIKEAIDCIQQQRDPDPKKTILAIIACMMAYYNSRDEEAPLKSEDLMNEAKPAEIGMAIITIVNMRAEFYRVPKGEPEDTTPSGKKGKGKAKN